MSSYASLQLLLDEQVEAARERIIYLVTAYMDTQGLMPCGRESAERTVAFARIPCGWTVFDDCADRLNIHALDGLGCCLTDKLRTRAVGVMGSGAGRMLRLYNDGHIKDTYISTPKMFKFATGRMGCRGHAIRWRALLREDSSIRDLSAAFSYAQNDPSAGFCKLMEILSLEETASYGFASIEDAGLEGVVTLYYCAANYVRQRWFDRFLKPAHCKGATVGAFFHRMRCKQWR